MKSRFWYLFIGFVVSLGIIVVMFRISGGPEIFKREHSRREDRIDEVRKLRDNGNLNEAIEMITHIIKQKKNKMETLTATTIEALLLSGELYIQKKEYNKASKNILKTLEIQPKNSWAFRVMGLLYREEDKNKLAEEYFKKAIKFAEKDIDKAHAHFMLGKLYSEQGSIELAIKNIKKATYFYPDESVFKGALSEIESRK